jgi:DNA ligase-1
MPDLADGEVAHVQGSAKDPYELKNVGGVYSCSCPAWRNAGGGIDRRTCKHLKAYRGAAAEAARLGMSEADLGVSKPKPAPKPKTSTSAGGDAGDDGDAASDGAPPVLLAHKWETDVDLAGWWMSEKLDGVRAYWDGTKFVSRLGNTFFAPKWFTAALPQKTLDGELWVGRKEFQTTVSIVRRQDASDEWKKVKFLVFDAPHLDLPFEDRIAWIKAFVADAGQPHVVAVDHEPCVDVNHLKTELARVEALGGEGLMMRRPGSKYEAGRSTSLLKVKTFHDAEGRVVGHEGGKGKHKGRLGALVLVMPDGTRFNVGTGFSDAERESPPPVGAIVTYRYQELTKDGVPRFPSYVGVAIDKAAPTAAPKTALPTAKSSTSTPAATPPAATPLASTSAQATKPVASSVPQATKPAPVATSPVPQATKPPPAPALSTTGARRFVVEEGGSVKFWEIVVDGAAHTVRFGKVGTEGQERTKTFPSEAAARDDAEKLAQDKLSKGYRPA